MGAPPVIHYHGTPITPITALYELAGRHFCVSFARPDDMRRVAAIAQSFMLDNGAFSKFKRGFQTDWNAYYAFCEEWLYPGAWAVIPDVIDAGSQEQDALIREWPHGKIKGAPVWHMDEPISRMLRLLDEWPRVCIGSTAEYWEVLSDAWTRRMDELWNEIVQRHKFTPQVHMLRGMQLSGERWPFSSVDSTDVARNHKSRSQMSALQMAERWDKVQCPARYQPVPHEQLELTNAIR